MIALPKSKYPYGYTKQEVLDIIRPLRIHHKTFWAKFGINTVAVHPVTNESLYYYHDVEITIECCLENRDKTIAEWD